jgi:glycosyltransferase involved in cell wall biosynthesis
MPNYNKGVFATQAAESVLAQTYANTELIFIDDHSTDGSDEPVRAMAASDQRVKFYITPVERSGGGIARNIGIKNARGKYIIFLDSDDLMDPHCVAERITAFHATPDLDFIAFPMGIFINKVGDTDFITNIPKRAPDIERFVLRDQPWLISGPIWKKDFLMRIGAFDISLSSQQDADLHVRALIHTDAYRYVHNAPAVHYRQEVESISRSNSQNYDSLLQRAAMLKNHLDMASQFGKLTDGLKMAIAQYFLDIAQMLRWHKATEGVAARATALDIWAMAMELVDQDAYQTGLNYIRFKHNMRWNRLPLVQNRIEQWYQRRLGNLIFAPSATLCKSVFSAGHG